MADSYNKLALPGGTSGAFSIVESLYRQKYESENTIQKNWDKIKKDQKDFAEAVKTTEIIVKQRDDMDTWAENLIKKIRDAKAAEDKNSQKMQSDANYVSQALTKKIDEQNKSTKVISTKTKEISKSIISKTIDTTKSFKNITQKTTDTLIKKTTYMFSLMTKFGSSVEVSLGKIKRSISNSSFCAFWEKTGSRFFNWLNGPGVTVWSLLSKVGSIWEIAKWVKDAVIGVVEYAADKLMRLGKFGWKVASTLLNYIVVTPLKTVVGFMGDAFKFFLTSPTGLFLLAGGATVAYIYLWPKIQPFFGKVFSTGWKWVKEKFDDFVKSIKQTKFYSYLADKVEFITDKIKSIFGSFFTGAKIKRYYDDTIGKWTGLDSKDLMNLFSNVKTFIVKSWKKMVDFFQQLKDLDIIKELSLTYNIIRTMVLSEDTVVKENSFEDSQRRIRIGLKNAMNDQLEAVLKNKLTEDFFNVYGGNPNQENISVNLKTTANKFIENVFMKNIDSFTNDADLQGFLKSNINVNTDSLVNEILHLRMGEVENYLSTNKTRLLKSSVELEDLQRIANDRNLQTIEASSALASELDDAFKKNRFDVRVSAFLDQQKALRDLSFTSTKKGFEELAKKQFDAQTDIMNIATNKAMQVNGKYEAIISAMISKTYSINDGINELAKNIETMTPGEFVRAYRDFLEKSGLNKQISEDEAAQYLKNILNQYGKKSNYVDFNNLKSYDLLSKSKAQYGLVAVKPVDIQIAEAGFPEMVIPLNMEGIKFINSTMPKMEEEKDNKKSKTEPIIRMFRRNAQKADITVYDMKNLSEGSLGLI